MEKNLISPTDHSIFNANFYASIELTEDEKKALTEVDNLMETETNDLQALISKLVIFRSACMRLSLNKSLDEWTKNKYIKKSKKITDLITELNERSEQPEAEVYY